MLISEQKPSENILAGGGELGLLMRQHDWASSPLGEPEDWPQSLRSVVGLLLGSKFPMFVAWGPELGFLYNDAYAEILGSKHPQALGRRFQDVWTEIWPDISPLIDAALAGEATFRDNLPLTMNRRGYEEQTWFTFSYSPVRDESGDVAGMYCACTETTGQVLAERRLTDERERQHKLFEQAPGFITILSGPELRFEFVNEAYERLFGRRGYVGKTVREAFPDLEGQPFFGLLDNAFATGERFIAHAIPIRLQATRDALPSDRFLDFIYEPVRDEDGAVTGLFIEGYDVTERVRAEQRRDALLRLDDRLRDVAAPADLSFTASELLGEVLGVSRVGFGIFDPDALTVLIERDWHESGYSDVAGLHRFEDYGSHGRDLKEGVPVVNVDIEVDPRTQQNAAALRSIGVAAFLDVPIVENGRTVAQMFVHSATPRAWTDDEIAFVRDFAERTRAAIARRQAEAALQSSEEFNRRVLASSADCIKVLSLEGHLEFMSEGGKDVMEVDDFEAVRNACWPDFWRGEEHAKALAAVEQATRGETARFQGFATTLKGSPRWWDVAVTPINGSDGRPEKLLSVSRDVTATREAEEQLRQLNDTLEARVAERTAERNLLATIVETTDTQIQALDLDYRWIAINSANADAYDRIYGVRPQVGESLLDLLADHPEERAGAIALWGRALAGESFTEISEWGDKEIDRRHYEMRFESLRDGAGGLIGAFLSGRDVTDRFREQQRLAEAEEALRQSQKMEAMGSLTGGVAHDFNNLLTPIIGSLDMLVRRSVGSERERRLIDGALQSAERAKTLVQRLLAFARRQPLQPTAVDVPRLVDGMAGLIGSTLGPMIEVRVELGDDLPPAKADPNQLEMALLNLAVNARDAMPDGGTLTIAAERQTVIGAKKGAVAPGHYIRLCVRDTGTGMDEATLQRAIEPFFSTKGIGKGTGLGLSMVHGLAAQLGGGLQIESRLGKGTSIELWLPISKTAIESDGHRPAAQAKRLGRGTALLVDDEDLVRMSTADMLMDLGFEVVEAGSAEDALQLITSGTAPDLLVTDHLMPGMSGAELANEARRLNPALPVLLVSGYAEVEGVAPNLPRLTKPFRNSDLAASLSALLP